MMQLESAGGGKSGEDTPGSASSNATLFDGQKIKLPETKSTSKFAFKDLWIKMIGSSLRKRASLLLGTSCKTEAETRARITVQLVERVIDERE